MNIPSCLYISFNDFKKITKVRLSLSVVFSSLMGYLLAAKIIDYKNVTFLVIGGYAIVGASNAFNQLIERNLDLKMNRTKNRPIPSGRVSPIKAFFIATLLTISGLFMLYLINAKTAFFGAISIFMYVCVYTPLKTKTPLCVFAGAFPGAIPFMLGWVAYTGSFGMEPGILFMLQFFWQFPHFWAIAWMLEEDYNKAGFKMLPIGTTGQATAFQIVFYTFWMFLISLLPISNFTGDLSLSIVGAISVGLLGLMMLYFGIKLLFEKTKEAAKKMMYASVGYISLVQIVYVIDKILN